MSSYDPILTGSQGHFKVFKDCRKRAVDTHPQINRGTATVNGGFTV